MQFISSINEFNKLFTNENTHKKKYVFCDFYASWCVSCNKIMPLIEEMNKKYNNNIHYIKIEIDENDDTDYIGMKYSIKKLPTFIIFDSMGNIINEITNINQNEIEKQLKILEYGEIKINKINDF